MEALSHHLQIGCPRELLYADDLVIIAETWGELLKNFCVWKTDLETKGLCVNVGKTKIIINVHNVPKPVETSKFPCCVCNKGVGSNSVKCTACGFWVQKCCSNIKGHLEPNPGVKYHRQPTQTSTLLTSMVKK